MRTGATPCFQTHGSVFGMIAVALLVFPKLALGFSGFETGVAVMPLVRGDLPNRPEHRKAYFGCTNHERISVGSSVVTTRAHSEPQEFRKGGEANGRALAFIAHVTLVKRFGTVYDISTILILVLCRRLCYGRALNLVPRYLPGTAWLLSGHGHRDPGSRVHSDCFRRDHHFRGGCGRARRRLCHRRPSS